MIVSRRSRLRRSKLNDGLEERCSPELIPARFARSIGAASWVDRDTRNRRVIRNKDARGGEKDTGRRNKEEEEAVRAGRKMLISSRNMFTLKASPDGKKGRDEPQTA